MTITEAIEILNKGYTPRGDRESFRAYFDAREMAIKSLEAWEKVKEGINEEIIKSSSNTFSLVIEDVLVHKALDIIDKHLKEVEHGSHSM